MKSVPKLFLAPTETCILNGNGYSMQNRWVGELIGANEIYYRIFPIDRYKKALTEVKA